MLACGCCGLEVANKIKEENERKGGGMQYVSKIRSTLSSLHVIKHVPSGDLVIRIILFFLLFHFILLFNLIYGKLNFLAATSFSFIPFNAFEEVPTSHRSSFIFITYKYLFYKRKISLHNCNICIYKRMF